MSNQLVKKNPAEGYQNVFPKTFIDAIKDKESGVSLKEILQGFNMYFLSYNGSRALTRCKVPTVLRKEGLWITYVLYDHTVVTEWYNSDKIDDASWGNDSNWRIASNNLVGDISISADGYWVINGEKTEAKAQGEQGVTPLLRIGANNKLQVSYNAGKGWKDISDYIVPRFRYTRGATNDTAGIIQISMDLGKTWTNLSNEITNNLGISRYIGINESLPTSGVAEGTVYMKGPYYDEGDTSNANPIYRMWVYAWKDNTLAWQDNGEFTSISAGVVQERGTSTTEVMSQDAVTRELTELEYYAGVQSDLNVNFTDKEDGSIDITFTKRVIFIKNGHRGFNLNFDQYPTTFNLPRYYTLALDVVTQEVKVENYGDGKDTPNRLVLLHNEPQGVFNGVFAPLYNFPKLGQYKAIDEGGSVISPYSSISIRKGDGSNLIVKFSAAKYNIINDYGSNPTFTIDAGTELIVPSYGAIFADIASRKIILSDGYYPRESKQILLAYNEGGVMLSGLLKGLYDKTFNDGLALINAERDFVDITYSQKISNAWVSATNVENRNDTNFDLYYFDIDSHTSKVQLYNATGGGHTIFLDADGNVLLTHQSAPQYQSAWYEYDVPQGTTMLKVTHAKWQEKYPYAFPLRVRANRQAYTNDNLLNLTGKKVVFFGDSITEMGYYVNAFQKMTGCNVVKRGASGTSFTKTTGRGYEDSLSERIDLPSSDAVGNKLGLPSEADLVIVLAGVNDWGQRNNWNIDFGTMTAAIDKTNFTGAVKYVFSKLREKYPRTPIIALSMLHVYHPTDFGTWREITYSDGQYGGEITYLTDKDGNTMEDWRKRVGEVANFYGIPFVNMTQCGFTPFLQSDNETFMLDGLHPSEEGGEIMAKYIIAQIKSLIS